MNTLRLKRTLSTLVAVVLFAACVRGQETSDNRWESAIQRFEQQDEQTPPPKKGVLFIGSSSIRNWDLEEYFPEQGFLNRGFGGSQIADSTHFASRIVMPYQPRALKP